MCNLQILHRSRNCVMSFWFICFGKAHYSSISFKNIRFRVASGELVVPFLLDTRQISSITKNAVELNCGGH